MENAGSKRQWDWKEVLEYCNERLDEIRAINSNHQCPSAFVCIAAFMGFLSRLAFGTNQWKRGEDGKCFRDFVQTYMPQKYQFLPKDLLYTTFRCGIVHAMSFDPEISEDRAIYLQAHNGGTDGSAQLAITHAPEFRDLCEGAQLKQESQTGMYVLVADVLCDDIAEAITKMFQSPDVQKNSEAYVRVQRPIVGILLPPQPTPALSIPGQQTKPNGDTGFVGVSGC